MSNTPIIYPYHIILPQDLREILQCLQACGYRAYVIGGCVRDSLLGVSPKDWDIATNAHPNTICEIFAHKPNLKLIHTGAKYGTIGVCINATCYEITTFRGDGIYLDSRHPNCVQFVEYLCEDVMRRDFSINALAYSESEGVLDYVNGVQDLNNKRLVCVGEAHIRFEEDSLRILRAVRFRATLGFILDSHTKDALLSLYPNITTLPVERIRLELDKTLMGTYACASFQEYIEVFAYLFAHLARDSYVHLSSMLLENIVHIHFLDSLELRYVWLLHTLPHNTRTTIIENLRFSKNQKNHIFSLFSLLSHTLPNDDRAILRLLSRFGAQNVYDALELWKLVYGDLGTLPKQVHTLAKHACYEIKNLKINGKIIKTLADIHEGKTIGIVLQTLLDEVIEQKLTNTTHSLIQRTQELLHQIQN